MSDDLLFLSGAGFTTDVRSSHADRGEPACDDTDRCHKKIVEYLPAHYIVPRPSTEKGHPFTFRGFSFSSHSPS